MEKQYRLPKAITEKWLEALRSGEYNQTIGMLYDNYDDSYCCLGLLGSICGISNKSLINKKFIQTDDYSENTIRKYRKMGYPEELSSLDTYISEDSIARLLSEMNDEDKSFSEIAQWIEENVELYE